MTKPHLAPCPACGRHVRVSEHACPFCTAELGDSLRAAPGPRPITSRLGRAALFALGASSMSVAVACGPSAPAPVAPVYGGPPVTPAPGAGEPTPADAGTSTLAPVQDSGEALPPRPPMALYGGPPPR
jgi:hypothetical protein